MGGDSPFKMPKINTGYKETCVASRSGTAYTSTSSSFQHQNTQQPTTSSVNSGESSSASANGNNNVSDLQNQVDQVVDIMRVNVSKVLERDQKLTELDERAENLADGSRQFQVTASRVKRKYWWQNCKMWFILIGVILVVIIIIIIAIVTSIKTTGGSTVAPSVVTTPKPSV